MPETLPAKPSHAAALVRPLRHALRAPPPLLQRFLLATLALWALCLTAECLSRRLLHLPEIPYGRLTLARSDDYADILMFPRRFSNLHSDQFFHTDPRSPQFLYPAAAGLLYAPYYRLAGPDERLFLALIAFTAVAAAWALSRLLQRHGLRRPAAITFAALSLLCSYPAFFEFNRANIELIVVLSAALGLWACLTDHPWRAAALFGFAGSLKLYPLLYLALLLPRRRYRAAAAGLLIAATITVASLWLLDPHLLRSFQGTRAGNQQFASTYIYRLRPNEVGLDHSLLGLVRRILPHLPAPPRMQRLVALYLALVATGGTLLFFTHIRRLPVLNQVLCLTVACILLPPVSYDYTLLHLYLPWTLFVVLLVRRHQQPTPDLPGAAAITACFALLLSPQNEFILHGVRFGGQLKAITLAILFGLALRFRLPSLFDQPVSPLD